jgi:hypothetical protein
VRSYYTLTEADVGSTAIRAFGHVWPVAGMLGPGRPSPHDVGKRVYKVNGLLRMETDEQRERRMRREARDA